MAEDVQSALDEMVPALKDLQDRQVFTATEIHQIVDRRRNSEFETRRRYNPQKADFLRYIQAEVDLESLRKLRTKKLLRLQQDEQLPTKREEGGSSKEKIGDVHILSHIHQLWKRTLQKFGKSDVALYLQYAEFCKEINAHVPLSRILAEALQLFPHNEGLWAEAASHEFFVLGSIQNSRVLLQRGIRLLQQKSQELWLQLFCLEMHFMERMKARRTILEGGADIERNEENEEDTENDSGNAVKDPHHVARMVYRSAVAAIPNEVAFRLKFWDQCRLFSDTASLQRDIVNSIRTDLCKDNPEAWMAWALYQWEQKSKGKENGKLKHKEEEELRDSDDQGNDGDEPAPRNDIEHESETETRVRGGNEMKGPAHKKRRVGDVSEDAGQEAMSVLDVLRQATQTLPTNEMYLKAVRMITRYIASLQEEGDEDEEYEDPDISAGTYMLETLFKEAEQSKLFSSELVMEHALLLSRLNRKDEAALCLKRFADARPTEDALKVWIHLAEISESGPVAVLKSALEKTDMSHPTYYELLLHLFGAKIQAKDGADLFSLFEKISLLTPGFCPLNEIEDPIFGVRHALDACLQFLRYLNEKNDIVQARKVYKNVLVESSLGSIFSTSFDDESLIALVEEAVKIETFSSEYTEKKNGAPPPNRKNLERLYDDASKLFGDSEVGRRYQERKREEMLGKTSRYHSHHRTPSFVVHVHYKNASSAFDTAFQKYQVAHLKGTRPVDTNRSSKKQCCLGWKGLVHLFQSLNKEDQSSWCVETAGNGKRGGGDEITPQEFLSPFEEQSHRGYCSFLVQNDKTAYNELLNKIPFHDPLREIKWHYPSGALWFFVGRNPSGNSNLEGRLEHTDSISFDGTWHYQLSGSKTWFLRPTPQLLEHFKKLSITAWNDKTQLRVHCEQGDIICVNTRLWFHSTVIPPQTVPSVTYARDFNREEKPREVQEDDLGDKGGMMNTDGLYATDEIEAGTIVFTEKDMPDCEMHRSSTHPNCQVVELEDGSSAVVSLRAISAGEFFCVAETDDEDDDAEEEDEGDNLGG